MNKGLGTTSILDDEKGNLVKYLQQNIYHFSAAKSFTQMEYYRDAMIGEDGAIIGKGSFIKKIANTGEIFNKTHLDTEYENAYYSSIMAHKWETLNADFIEYSTVGDRNVRPEHAALNKFTAPKDHAVWKKIYPPNGWNCRCTVVPGLEQNSEKKITANEAGALLKPILKDTPFENNVGLSKVIFKDNHPYFVNANGKEVNLSWQQYGLPSLDKIRTDELPNLTNTTKDEYFDWWKKQSKKGESDDIIVKDALQNEIILPSGEGKGKSSVNYFKDHILKKESESRFEFASETKNILRNPDEVWMNPKDKNTKSYLKYYEEGVIKVIVNENNQAVSIYKLDNEHEGALGKARKGILMYRN